MYLKTLTLKGFKSFASATTMRLEPGITCIVGPNGSGKSNVVDGLAWVMGEQGAKSLRGGKMEDVIFGGTAGRPPLGRAEVSLTIDNTDGALPIDYAEVTITRTMFRNGGSEYAINSTPCRLLDVQELLSDSGIGREMHVIVGQGQLDAVLRATPEERRGFIEEAAGVLKHRKRKERALRKLETMEANLTRVTDLTGEIRRQLGPLGRQAEAARRAAVIQAEARDARLRLLADDLVQLTSTLAQEVADETALIARRTELENTVVALRGQLRSAEDEAAAAQPMLTAAADRWVRFRSLVDRLDSTARLAADRVRLLFRDEQEEDTAGRDPQQLRAQAEQARAAEQDLLTAIDAITAEVSQAVTARTAAEQAYATEQDRIAQMTRAAADRREGIATLAGQVASRRSRIETREAEIARLQGAVQAALDRAAEHERDFAKLEATVATDEEGEEDLDGIHEAALSRAESAKAAVDALMEEEREADRDRSAAIARVEALQLTLRRQDGAAALLATAEAHGILGPVAELLNVETGFEAAVAAALGWAGDALAVDSAGSARSAVASLRARDSGRADLLVAATAQAHDRASWGVLPAGARWAVDVVGADPRIEPAVRQLLARVAIVPDPARAAEVVDRGEGLTAVTSDGDVFGPGFVRGGSQGADSVIELQAALDAANAAAAAATARGEQARFALVSAREEAATATGAVEAALEALHQSDARMAAVAEHLGSLGSGARNAKSEAERLSGNIAAATAALATDQSELTALADRLERAVSQPGEIEEPSTQERDRLEIEASRARTAETEIRLSLRTQEERARSLRTRAESLEGAARNELAARERLRERRERRVREREVAAAVAAAATYGVGRAQAGLAAAHIARDNADQARQHRETTMAGIRTDLTSAQDELAELTDSVHRDEVARAAQFARIEQLQAKAIEELGIDPETLTTEYGPDTFVPYIPGPDEPSDPDQVPEPTAYVREEQEKRLRRAERGLSALGRVNPLALEEFAALEERHKFLTEQLEDLRRSKEDLLDIVREVDTRVQQVFGEAFADTAVQFERVFERLFPGGEGRIFLTDPDDLLTTGIEVEARPPGKKVKRLSLLSGGERSLVAVALLVAIFKARPSPFYIMDEVEAALDDTNLGRLITLFEELRDSSQLIVITHQKRTMEVADALYGVSMRGDGVTTVVSQRIRDLADDTPNTRRFDRTPSVSEA
ncbi:MAG: chromosome segregation protein SMC [Nostocoides sp.]